LHNAGPIRRAVAAEAQGWLRRRRVATFGGGVGGKGSCEEMGGGERESEREHSLVEDAKLARGELMSRVAALLAE
jgi:hypothetical protein